MTTTRYSRRRALRGMATIGLVTVLGAGCQFGLDDGGDDPASGQQPSDGDGGGNASDGGGDPVGGAGSGGDPQDTVEDEDAQAAGVDLSDVGEPIASAEVPATVEGDPEATMTVSLYSLTRRDSTLVAIYSFRVEASAAASTDPRWIYHYLGSTGWDPYAIDTTNLTKHGVLKGGNGLNEAQTAHQGTKFRPGQTFYAYAMFAAPPEDVTTMDVLLVEGAPLATEVEIR